MTIKLHLGCGDKPKEGFVNIDLMEPENLNGHAFIQHDLRKRLPFDANSADEIYSQHVIEHFTPGEWDYIKYDWARVLKKGGKIRLECPDIIRSCESFASDRLGMRWTWWHHVLYGDENNGGAHRQGFTIPRLRADLELVGLTVTRARYWHDDVNDKEGWSEYNILVEAVKP